MFFLFFASGCCGLIYEVTWMRLLPQALGTTATSVATVLCVFMAGLAIGSFVAGRFADSLRPISALRTYGVVQMLVALCAFAVPHLLHACVPGYVWLYRNVTSSFGWLLLVRTLVSALILLVPTILMGMTFPLMVRFLAGRRDTFGRDTGLLYGVNTVGGVVGCALAGFFLIEALGIRGAGRQAALINVLVGFAAWLLCAREGPQSSPVLGDPDSRAPEEEAARHDARAWLPVLVAGISGFAALGYETLWTRELLFYLGTMVRSFSIILITFLLANAIGAYALGRLADRASDLRFVLGTLQCAIGALAMASPWLIYVLCHSLTPPLSKIDLARFATTQAGFVVAAGAFFLPALLMGGSLAVALRWVRSLGTGGGRTAGRVVGVNTIGAAIGPVCVGFVLVPVLGVHRSIVLLALLNVAVGAVLLAARRPRRRLAACAPALLAAVGLVLLVSPSDPFVQYAKECAGGLVVAVEQGTDCTVVVAGDPAGDPADRSLFINGIAMAAPGVGPKMRAHLPMLLHRKPEEVLVIGLGTGTSAGVLGARYPEAMVDVVEISPTVVKAAKHFAACNYDVLSNPRVHLIVEDARSYVDCTSKTYDVIASDPPHPYDACSSQLFSHEFYEACRARLADGGLFLQWIPLDMSPGYELKAMVRTFLNAFPEPTVWSGGLGSLHLVGSETRSAISVKRVQDRIDRYNVAEDLRDLGLHRAERIIGTFAMDKPAASRWVGAGPIITDDWPIIEFTIPRLLWDETERGRLIDSDAVEQHVVGPSRYLVP